MNNLTIIGTQPKSQIGSRIWEFEGVKLILWNEFHTNATAINRLAKVAHSDIEWYLFLGQVFRRATADEIQNGTKGISGIDWKRGRFDDGKFYS